jgi:hypothetical protein
MVTLVTLAIQQAQFYGKPEDIEKGSEKPHQ